MKSVGLTPSRLLGRYDYNAEGMRVRHRNSERGDIDYFYDDGAVLEERLASGSLLAHYRYADRLLSLDTGGEVQYYHHDGLGSTVNLTGPTGAVKVRYTLDPWGHIRNQIGASINRQIFTGQEHDEQTGLIYFGARYYDPDTARFISQDSYLGEPGTPPSLHRYLYAYSNPTVYIDLNGYKSLDFLKSPLNQLSKFIEDKIDDLSISQYRNKFTESFFEKSAVALKRAQSGIDLLQGAVGAADLTIDAQIAKAGLIGRMAGIDQTLTKPYEERISETVTNALETGKFSTEILLSKEKRDAAIDYGKGVLKTKAEKYAQGDLNIRAGLQVGVEETVASVLTGGSTQMTKLRNLPKYINGIKRGLKSVDNIIPPKLAEQRGSVVLRQGAGADTSRPEIETEYINLASRVRTKHILYGDGPGSGGHLWPGQPDKTPFPQDWTAARIMHEVSDVATDPKLQWVRPDGKRDLFYKSGKAARFTVTDPVTGGLPVRDGVPVQVILEPAGEGIITGYPKYK